MKVKRVLTLCLAVALMTSMVATASAADYSFSTDANPEYYGSTTYEALYDAAYNYGRTNQIDYDTPEIKYGLSQEFLETSLNNPYLSNDIQYGIGSGSSNTAYPESNFTSSSVINGNTIEVSYRPYLTVADVTRADGSIGTVSISRVGLKAKVYEGATDTSMAKGAGHYAGTSLFDGNISLFGHNRGSNAYFKYLKNVKVGDTVVYETNQGSKTYEVIFVGTIANTDYSYMNEMGDNRITMITCVANQPSLRLCVQAKEIY